LTSLFTKSRLEMILRYAIVYVDRLDDDTWELIIEKHIMRYPQFFATKAIERKLNEWVKKWVIRHTQWSGKTALAFYNIRYLTDYFKKKWVVPKFYFVVDRLDLLVQTEKEFRDRWLKVHIVNNKQDLIKDFKSNTTNEW
jgi:type I restriction enzyme R subunit